MKSISPKPWFAPQPVLIIGTYNKEGVANAMNAAWAGQWDMKEIMISMGNPDMEKMELIVFDPIHHGYIQLGEKVGNAFSDGKALK